MCAAQFYVHRNPMSRELALRPADASRLLTSHSCPQPTCVISDLASHFKFVHHCPSKGSKKQLLEN